MADGLSMLALNLSKPEVPASHQVGIISMKRSRGRAEVWEGRMVIKRKTAKKSAKKTSAKTAKTKVPTRGTREDP
jgi:hypothetical protein